MVEIWRAEEIRTPDPQIRGLLLYPAELRARNRPQAVRSGCVQALIEVRPGIRAAELCRVLGIKSANMVELIAELEERGLVERDEHAGDKRVQVLRLTRAAREAMPA